MTGRLLFLFEGDSICWGPMTIAIPERFYDALKADRECLERFAPPVPPEPRRRDWESRSYRRPKKRRRK